jgi:hypothetical protein
LSSHVAYDSDRGEESGDSLDAVHDDDDGVEADVKVIGEVVVKKGWRTR